MATDSNILTLPYQQLPVSKSLKRFMNVHQLATLEMLLQYPLATLLKMKWFNMHSFMELYTLLKKEGVEHQLKPS